MEATPEGRAAAWPLRIASGAVNAAGRGRGTPPALPAVSAGPAAGASWEAAERGLAQIAPGDITDIAMGTLGAPGAGAAALQCFLPRGTRPAGAALPPAARGAP